MFHEAPVILQGENGVLSPINGDCSTIAAHLAFALLDHNERAFAQRAFIFAFVSKFPCPAQVLGEVNDASFNVVRPEATLTLQPVRNDAAFIDAGVTVISAITETSESTVAITAIANPIRPLVSIIITF